MLVYLVFIAILNIYTPMELHYVYIYIYVYNKDVLGPSEFIDVCAQYQHTNLRILVKRKLLIRPEPWHQP